MFTVVDDFQRWLGRFGRRPEEDVHDATAAPSAVG
jgi:hypothetical protein